MDSLTPNSPSSATNHSQPAPNRIVVFVGPSACGKTAAGQALAKLINAIFLDADDYHTAEAKEHMHAGHPLSDEDRWPWLERVRTAALEASSQGTVILACSALTPELRRYLDQGSANWNFVGLDVDEAILRQRLKHRTGHFFPAVLLDSQLDEWQPLKPAEGIVVDGHQTVSAIAEETRQRLHLA